MTKRESIRKELADLYKEGADLLTSFQKKEDEQFQYDYQRWYTRTLKAVTTLAPDRSAEFRGYYEIDPKRKHFGYGTYAIQDFLRGVAPDGYRYPGFDTRDQVITCFFNQLTILHSVQALIVSMLATSKVNSMQRFRTTKSQSLVNLSK